MKDLVGQTLGAYRILEQIGRGGMATVFKAYQPALDRYVAIKVLPPHLADEPGFTRRFRREARAVAQLEHPHILAVYDSGQEDDLSYLVMRFVEAGTLKAQMGHPLDLDRVTDLISQISEALDYAHKKGIVHRDIKPSNILMDRGDWALLSDFGLAKMMEGSQQITETGVGLGTPDYMSPEQGMAERVDQRSDIYSLGVVLYEMLTGRVPYKADTPMAVVLKHIHDPLPLPREINPNIPEAIERVVLKAMAKDPGDRFERARDLAEALREALRGVEISGVGLSGTSAPLFSETSSELPAPGLFRRTRRLVWALPVALAMVAVGLLVTQIPIRVQIVGGRLEIVSIEQATQTSEPADEVSNFPTAESTDLPQAEGLEREAPVIAATYGPDAPLYDNFESQGGLDSSKWVLLASSPPECLMSQSNGAAKFSNQADEESLICILGLEEPGLVPIESLGFVEAEFYAVGDNTGDYGSQMISIFTDDIEGEYWYAQCGLEWNSGQYSAFSNVANFGRDQESEEFVSVPADAQTWYRVRIEVDPGSGEFSCFLDDRLVDRYIPGDIEQLRDAQLGPALVSYRTPGSFGTFWADNVRISELVAVRDETPPTPTLRAPPPTEETVNINPTLEFVQGVQVSYQTEFEDMVDFFKNWQQQGAIDITNGYLVVSKKSSGVNHKTPLREGEGILVLFRYGSGTMANIVLFDSLSASDKYVGIQPSFAPSLKISLGYNGEWIGGQQLNGNLIFAADHWYYGLIEIRNGGQFYIKVWDRDNPNLYREKLLPMGAQWENSSWYGSITTNQYNEGIIEVDSYQELQLDSNP